MISHKNYLYSITVSYIRIKAVAIIYHTIY